MTTTTTNTVNINLIPVDQTDPTKTAWGPLLQSQYYFAIANGTAASEIFNAADIASATLTLMATYQRGVSVNMGAGDDTVTGSAWGDNISAGDGTNYVDGGDDDGLDPNGNRARDVLNVFAASQAAADALSVTAISASATGADGAAYASGYRIKVSNGTETDYLKNVEQVNVFISSGTSYTYARSVRLALDVMQIDSAQAAVSMHMAWAQGTDFSDTFNAAADLSADTLALMAANGRGVWVDTGAGDDTVTGSGFGDDISAGSGTNYVDGGANAGSPPWGGNAADVLHVTVADQAAAGAVQVVQLTAAMTGVDGAAFGNGYAYKILAGTETDYVKGIERVSVQVAAANGGSTWVRDIALAVVVREADLASPNNYHLAWITGTANNDQIDASGNTALLSDAAKAALVAQGRGVWIDGGDGNDTITGTAFADNFRNGAGNAHIDGGANGAPNGQGGMDVFEISVATTAAMAAVTVAASDDPAYTWMVTYGAGSTQKDYLKNVEAITVNVSGTSTGKWIPLAVNVHEIAANGDLANSLDYAWAQGTSLDDTFDATTDVSAATRTLMDQHQRGVWADLGAGNDTVTGSAYGDDISAGSGTNFVDGGGNAGTPPWGGKALDTLHVTVADQAAANGVQVLQLANGMSGADGDAFARGYTFKVVAGGETDYIKGIERVSVQVDTGNGSSNWVRDIPLAVVVQEANMADPNSSQFYHLAWVNGTASADAIDASAASPLLSSAIKASMDANKRGVWIDGGAGGDTITGTAYADNIRNGAGNDKIDGGANASADGRGMDVFEISVADTAAMSAVTVSASDDPAYTWMVTYGAGSTQKDYLKNVEGIIVGVANGGASKWIPLAISVYESTHPATEQVAFVQGTDGADTFSAATGLSATALANADANKHGIYADLGAGDDTATGTAYGDDFNMGSGTNYLDGGANTGTAPWGGRASDALHVVVQTQAEVDAVQVTALTSGMSGADADAFGRGYTQKVVAAGQVDYVKGIEHVFVSTNAAGGIGRDIALEVSVREADRSDPNIGSFYNLAWVNGTSGNDTIDTNALLSDTIKAEMASRKRGAWIDGGSGNDVITGTGFADNFRNGAGNAKVDGGANDAPAGQKGLDVFEIAVGSTAELGAISVVASDDPDYQWMVTYGAGSTQKDYLKNIEGVSINVTGTSTGKWVPLAINVTEVDANSSQLDQLMQYASVQGTALGESFDATTDISAATRTLMTQHGRGVYADMGAGNDVIVGSAYGDYFVAGAGTNYVDGGTNLGAPPGGGAARDVIEVFAPNQAAADAVTVTKLTATMTGEDGAAYAAGYRIKIANGTAEVDYVRNVETLNISIWNDKNGDGNRDYRVATDAANEVTLARSVSLTDAPDTAPTFRGAPAGVAISDAGYDYGSIGGVVLASGKMLAMSWLSATGAETSFVLNRSNADGSVDTTFGGGTGRVVVPTSFSTGIAPLELAGGKVLVGVTTYGSNTDLRVLRLNADGSLDTTFGTNGSTVVSIGSGNDQLRKMTVDATGRIILAGTAESATGKDMAVVRLTANGTLDTTFNGSGKLTVSLADGTNNVNSVTVGADGKLVLGGFAPGTGSPMALVRINADGTLDNSFGTGGKLTVIGGAGPSQATVVQVLADGKIMVAGQARTSTVTGADNDPVLMRLNADGSLDTSFGTNGMVKAHPTDRSDILTSMLVQADGKIVTLGMVNLDAQGFGGLVAVTRYNADGSLDTSFGDGGSSRLALRGVGEQVNSMALVNGKIVVFGSTANDVNFDTSNVILRLNTDGSLDATFATASPSSLGGTVRVDGYHVATLDQNAAVYDAELAARGHYAGASLTLARQGGASADDVFSGVGEVSFDGGVLKVGNVAIGAVAQAGGTLAITFNSAASQGLVNRALHGIGYSNAANLASGSVTIGWTFSDGNDGSQGTGGVQSASGSTIVQIGMLVLETARSVADPSTDVNHTALASLGSMGRVIGTAGNDVFDSATGFSANARGLMDSFKKGAVFDMGPGNDTVTGTAYADTFIMGSGSNRVSGGGNATSGQFDVLNVYTASSADADAVQFTSLDANSTGADKDAFAAGYKVKVVSGSETDYLANIQQVNLWTWNDANGNHQREPSEVAFLRSSQIGVRVFETQFSTTDTTKDVNGSLLSSLYNFASANGSNLDDAFNAGTDVSAATRGRMDEYKRGVFVDGGAGNDTAVGSAYGDNFVGGAGVNKIDGGANSGTDPNGYAARDYLSVYVTGATSGVTALKLTSLMTGDDGAAYAAGYAWKVNAPGETDYVKNVEEVSVWSWNDANQNGVRDTGELQFARSIQLATRFDDVMVSATDATRDTGGNLLSTYMFMTWGFGTRADDIIDATTGASAKAQGLMTQYGRGAWLDAGDGNDTLVGSAYGDSFVGGAGVNKIDGRANLGTDTGGNPAHDALDVYVADQAGADAVAVSELSATMTGADGAAFAEGYRYKVTNGSVETDYLKGVEQVNISIWNDKDGDGQRDFDSQNELANEVTFVRGVTLNANTESNTAPTFSGAPVGVALSDAGVDFGAMGGTVLTSGKLLALSWQRAAGAEAMLVLNRNNADGSVDTSFGGGSGRVVVPTSWDTGVAPVELANGQVLVAVTTFGNSSDFKVLRLNADGSLDTTFGTNGATTVSFGPGADQVRKLALDPTGKIVVLGNTPSATGADMAVLRLTANGALDTTFNGSGKLTVKLADGANSANAVSFDANGKMVLAGSAPGAVQQLAIVRVNADGTLDSGFGTGGKVTLAGGIGASIGNAVQVLAGGKILVGGNARTSTAAGADNDPVLLRLNADGTLDQSFGSGGMVKAHPGDGGDTLTSMLVQPDGKIVTLGLMNLNSQGFGGMGVVTRYNADGSLDTSFGIGGSVSGTVRGVGEQVNSLALVNGKIVVFGSTINDTSFNTTNMIVRVNSDGTLDSSFGAANPSSLGDTVRVDGYHATALDLNASVFDAELAQRGNYGGATVTLARHGGASADDVFAGVGEVTFSGNAVKVGTLVVGTFAQSGGTLSITFNSAASQGMVNRALHGIGYTNNAGLTSGTVTIDWTFSDANDGSQGFGGASSASGSTTVQVGMQVTETVRSGADPTLNMNHVALAGLGSLGTVNGSGGNDVFDSATGFSAAARALMGEFKMGATFDMGPGDDRVTGTAHADTFVMGSGSNRVDGGGNDTSGRIDLLNVYAANTADAGAVQITKLDATATDTADKDAFAAGYNVKVVNGTEIDYLKNIQEVAVWTWNDTNGNHVREFSEVAFWRNNKLGLSIFETQFSTTDTTKDANGNLLSSLFNFANVNGWKLDDSFSANTDISAATRARMDEYKRGVFVDTGDGNDTVVGSGYGDNINVGTGVNHVDGGANAGTDPNGFAARDFIQVYVADPAAVSAVRLTSTMDGADLAAYQDGYQWRVSAPGETDFVKNIEEISVFKWTDANNNGVRDAGEVSFGKSILFAPHFDGISVSATDPTKDAGGHPLSGASWMAWGNGTTIDDVIDATTGVSAATRTLMTQYQRGAWIDAGAGNDTIVGTAYGDNVISGTGINKVDGGDNQGTDPSGNPASDVLELYVADQAAADAVAVTELTSGMTGADGTAFAEGYKFKVVNGSVSTDYIKGIEQLSISIWNDKDGDGQRKFADATDPVNEVTYVRNVTVGGAPPPPPPAVNAGPSFALAKGMMGMDGGYDFAPSGMTTLSDGKILSVVLMNMVDLGQNYTSVLVRNNADGSVDTSFGGGTGRVFPLTTFGAIVTAPLVQSDGKILWATSIGAGASTDFKVVRYNADGSPDTSFGTGGSAIVSLSAGAERPRALLLDADGKILVAGTVDSNAADSNFGVVRLNPDGSLDTSYGDNGKLVVAITGGADRVNSAVLQADGKLVVIGSAPDAAAGGAIKPAVMRVNTNGTLDLGFAVTGKAVLPTGPGSATAVAMLADGSMILAGDSTGNSVDIAVVKLKADGTFDTAFGANGGVILQQDGQDEHTIQMLVQADGKIVIASSAGHTVQVLRMNVNGSVDTSFGQNGSVKLAPHGLDDRAVGMSLVGDKIVLQIGASYDIDFSETTVLARLNADGSLDTGFGAGQPGSLGSTVRGDGVRPTVLDINASVFDPELAARNDYAGASLTLARHGGGNADDQIFGTGEVNFSGGVLTVAGQRIGHVTFATGSVSLIFEAGATQGLVNRALHGISYANASATPPASVTIDWTFADGNDGSQGSGGTLGTLGSTTVQIGVVTSEAVRAFINPNQSADGRTLADIFYLGTVYGTRNGETVDANALSATVRALMDQYKHGASFVTRGGGDSVSGTGYGDNFTLGKGVNFVDGGANTNGSDVLTVVTANQADADALQAVRLDASSQGADAAAFASGYTVKVTTAGGTETDYLKNVEFVSAIVVNSSGAKTYQRDVALAVTVNEADLSASNLYHLAWINGSDIADTINLSGNTTLLSDAVKAAMTSTNHGIYVDGRGGNDTITGTAHPDNFANGPGNSHIDGGDQIAPAGTQNVDVFEVTVASAELVASVKAVASDDPAYTWMVTYGAGSTQKDYLKNVEGMTVQVAGSSAAPKWIPLALDVFEETGNPVTAFHLAYIHGTSLGESFDAATGLSSQVRALMDLHQRGVNIDMGSGGDTMTGSAYGDRFSAGTGTNYIDGGDDLGTDPNGNPGNDILEVFVADATAAAKVTSTLLVSSMSGADKAAFDLGYTYKIVSGDEIDYVKNIEQYDISIWVDKNGDGQKNYSSDAAVNEVTYVASHNPADAQSVTVVGVPVA